MTPLWSISTRRCGQRLRCCCNPALTMCTCSSSTVPTIPTIPGPDIWPFPGGRQEPEDPDLFVTIQRETYEEVGIDLAEHGEYLGRLAEVQASARGKQIGMVVSPFVYLVSRDASPVLDPVEVQDVIWVPLSFMQQDGVEQIVQRKLQTGSTIQVPALLYGGKTIWGLTYRMLQGFLELITEP